MNKLKLLFVEDDFSFAFVVKGSLELTGQYEICMVTDGKKGVEAYSSFKPDVIVSDVEMPGMDGMEMVRQIRQKDKEIPILFATARTNAQDVLDGYELNVDNFIKKPYLPQELDKHIQAIFKRLKKNSVVNDKIANISLGEYIFYFDTHVLQWKNERYKLTPRESEILWKLYEYKGRLLNREDLLQEFWGTNDFFTSRSLDVFIHSLRKFLSHDTNVKIQTIRGQGFQLTIP